MRDYTERQGERQPCVFSSFLLCIAMNLYFHPPIYASVFPCRLVCSPYSFKEGGGHFIHASDPFVWLGDFFPAEDGGRRTGSGGRMYVPSLYGDVIWKRVLESLERRGSY